MASITEHPEQKAQKDGQPGQQESLCHDTNTAQFSKLLDDHPGLLKRVSRSQHIVLDRDGQPQKFKEEVVDWVMQQLFGFENPRFAILRIPFSVFASTNADYCFDNAFNRLLPNMLVDILDRCKERDFKHGYMFPAPTMRQYAVAGKHKKWRDRQWPSGDRRSLKLHWDPLSIPILGTVYHKDENVGGGHALVSDLARYLHDVGGSVANGVYAKGLLDDARIALENDYMTLCPIGKQLDSDFDCITLQLVNNHIDLADYRKCGVLHTNQGSNGTGLRRVALVSIQDIGQQYQHYSSSDRTKNDQGIHQYAKFPYVTPPFRAIARAHLNDRKIQGFFDCEEGPVWLP